MTRLWISLPARWQLQDVQAGVSVVINALSFLASFTYLRICWQRAAGRIANGRSVPLHSLVTVNAPTEALDVLLLLKQRLFSRRYINICFQCIIIIVFWALHLFSGPIGRYSTRREIVLKPTEVPGFLATSSAIGIASDTVGWTDIMTRLNSADFPQDQVLDYLPDNSVDWSFDRTQWNNSWPLDCRITPETAINLEVNGTCGEKQNDIFGFDQALDLSRWAGDKVYNITSYFNAHNPTKIKDVLYIGHGAQTRWYPNATGIFPGLNIFVLVAYLHGVPTIESNGTGCRYGQGPIDHSSYVMVECDQIVSNETFYSPSSYGARPDSILIENVTNAYKSYYEGRFFKESAANTTITTLQPKELTRFYQAVVVDIAILDQTPARRIIDLKVPVPQLSVIFLAIALLIAMLIVIGLVNHGLFACRHTNVMLGTPLSKVDWMIQSIEAEDRPHVDAQGRPRWNATVDLPTSWRGLKLGKRKANEFQAATYSDRATSTTFLTRPTAPPNGYSGPNRPVSYTQQDADEAMIHDDQASTLNEDVATDVVRLGRLK